MILLLEVDGHILEETTNMIKRVEKPFSPQKKDIVLLDNRTNNHDVIIDNVVELELIFLF